MKKKIFSFIFVFSMISSIISAVFITTNAASEKEIIVSNEYECSWGFYEAHGRWYISELGNPSQKRDVYSLGPIEENVGWLDVGRNAARLNSSMNKITIDNYLSSNTNTRIYDEGNRKYINYPYIIYDRERIEGQTVNIAWYYFQVGQNWYIVNKEGTVSRMIYNNDRSNIDWVNIDIENYVPAFNIRNNKMYVEFEKESSSQSYNTPPRLTGYTSMPSQIPYREGYYINGQIISDSPITKVTVSVFKRDGSWKDTQSVSPNSYTYDLSKIDKNLHFASYPTGEMEIQIWAVNSAGAFPLIGDFEGQKQNHGEFFTIVGGSNSGEMLELDVPLYKQNDSRWANVKIGNKTIGAVGCTTTAIAMVYSYHTGRMVYPNDMRYKLNYSKNDLLWGSLSSVGLNSKEYMSGVTQSMLSTIHSKLRDGRPVIIGADTTSGTEQHWVVIIGYKDSGMDSYSTSDFTINDPGFQSSETLAEFLANGSEADRTRIKRIIY